MSSSLFEIYWLEGSALITRVPDFTPSDAALGVAVNDSVSDLAPEMDVCYDPSLGLWAEYRYRMAAGSFDAAEAKRRGVPTENKKAFHYWIVSVGELPNVALVKYLGEPILIRLGGELVPTSRVEALADVYLDRKDGAATVAKIGRIVSVMERELAEGGVVGDEADAEIADRLGMSAEMVGEAKAFLERIEADADDQEQDDADWDDDFPGFDDDGEDLL